MVYISLLILGVLIWLLYRKSAGYTLSHHFIPAVLFKLLTGVSVGLVYFYFYREGDTVFFDRSVRSILASLSTIKEWSAFLINSELAGEAADQEMIIYLSQSRTLLFIKILSVLYVFNGSNYWITSLYLSFFSFFGAWILANAIVRYRPDYGLAASLSFLFFPTMVFWSSGVLKESLAFPLICIVVAIFIRWVRTKDISVTYGFAGMAALGVLWMIKYHYAAILILCILSAILYAKIFSPRKGLLKYTLIICSIGFMISFVHPNFNLYRVIGVMHDNHEYFQEVSADSNLIPFFEHNDKYLQFILNIPVALFGGLFMPLPGQGNNWLITLTGLLNLIILIFLIAKIRRLHHFRISGNSLVLSWIFYVLILAVIIAYTTPNFGTLERYKTGYLPFFLLWVFSFNPLLSSKKRLFRN